MLFCLTELIHILFYLFNTVSLSQAHTGWAGKYTQSRTNQAISHIAEETESQDAGENKT